MYEWWLYGSGILDVYSTATVTSMQLHCERKKHTQMFLTYLQNLADFDKNLVRNVFE